LTLILAGGQEGVLPIFQLEPQPGQLLSFGSVPAFDISLESELRADDFGVSLRATDLPPEPILEGHVDLWGVPADHQSGTSIPRRPLLTLPSVCGPMEFGFQTRSSEEGAPLVSATTETLPLEGCEGLRFRPGLDARLSDPVADSPTGLRLDIGVPGEDDP